MLMGVLAMADPASPLDQQQPWSGHKSSLEVCAHAWQDSTTYSAIAVSIVV